MTVPTFTLDGCPIDINQFITVNEFEPTHIELIEALPVDGEIIYGGGAAPTCILRREA